jgi:hypothetical protein
MHSEKWSFKTEYGGQPMWERCKRRDRLITFHLSTRLTLAQGSAFHRGVAELRVPFVTTKCLEVFEENLSWFSYSVT